MLSGKHEFKNILDATILRFLFYLDFLYLDFIQSYGL